MGLAWLRVGAASTALFGMSCVVTDKIDFELVPPNVTAVSPPTVSERPSADTGDCSEPGIQFFYTEFNEQSQGPLARRVLVNGVYRFNADPGSFCVPYRLLGGADAENRPTNPGCYRVELVVSHGFKENQSIDSPATPIVEGDVDSAIWYVGVQGADEQSQIDLWEKCVPPAPPLSPTTQGQQLDEGGAGQ